MPPINLAASTQINKLSYSSQNHESLSQDLPILGKVWKVESLRKPPMYHPLSVNSASVKKSPNEVCKIITEFMAKNKIVLSEKKEGLSLQGKVEWKFTKPMNHIFSENKNNHPSHVMVSRGAINLWKDPKQDHNTIIEFNLISPDELESSIMTKNLLKEIMR